MASGLSSVHAKAFGAYYTDPAVADFLLSWAAPSGRERVLDPSFGGGVFLEAAIRRVRATQVYGVELDPGVQAGVAEALYRGYGIPIQNLLLADFFDVLPCQLGRFDAVVGNPPFIRYQRAPRRDKALQRAREAGVHLSSLASIWAPFVAHSASMLKPGGRLAMVIPSELAHASYARPLLSFLREKFASLMLLSFHTRLFPQLGQDTLLLLAEGMGQPFTGMRHLELESSSDLPRLQLNRGQPIDAEALVSGQERFVLQLVPKRAAALYRELAQSQQVARLGALAEVGIGYVTGANSFFHLSPLEVGSQGLPEEDLRRAVFRTRALRGLHFSLLDWQQAAEAGNAGYLFLPSTFELAGSTRAYVEKGEREGIDLSYKCRNRQPWFLVPHVRQAEAFLAYMSSTRPGLAVNEAGAVAPNTLLLVRPKRVSARTLAALWQSSLTSLSAEVEGHALGGGLLKLEPGEARRVLLPLPVTGGLEALSCELDDAMRRGKQAEVRQQANYQLLQVGLGLSASDCRLLEEAAQYLRERRQPKRRLRSYSGS